MLGYYNDSAIFKKTVVPTARFGQLIGYILSSTTTDIPGAEAEASERMIDKCTNTGFRLPITESDVGISGNPMRMGLWRVLRRLICSNCQPKQMPFTMMNFDDFLHQALSACQCRSRLGMDGILVTSLDQLTNNKTKLDALLVELTKNGKHLIAEDNICLTCCHPATRAFTTKGQ